MKRTILLLTVIGCLTGSLAAQIDHPRLSRFTKRTVKHDSPAVSHIKNPAVRVVRNLKATQVVKQALTRTDYENYDADSSDWVNVYSDAFEYDAAGRQTCELWYDCENNPDSCLADYRADFTYDGQGNRTMIMSYWRNPDTGLWENSGKQEMTYDAAKNLIGNIYLHLDDSTKVWIPSWKSELTYDTNNHPLTEIEWWWIDNTSQWIYHYKNAYQYDNAGNMVLHVSSQWDVVSSAWVAYSKEQSDYNAAGNLTEHLDYGWDMETSQWVFEYKTIYVYNANEKVSACSQWYWNPEKGTWEEQWLDEFFYDNMGNLTEDHAYESKDSIGNWEYQYKETFNYDNAYSLSDLLLPEFYVPTEFFNHKLINILITSLDDSTQQWIPEVRMSFRYTEMNIGGIPEFKVSNISVFPNPAVDEIMIVSEMPMELAKFELCDIQGRIVLVQTLEGTRTTVSVKELKSGIYFYRISGNNDTRRGKIMIE